MNTENYQPVCSPPVDLAAVPGPTGASHPEPATCNGPTDSLQLATAAAQPASNIQHPVFNRLPGETPRAFSAFKAFFALGHSRSLQGAADHLGEKLDAIKRWSSRFRWSDRIHSFDAGLLQQAAAAEAARRSQETADWARRTAHYREHEWETAHKLLAAIDCFLDDFSDRDVEKMTLSQISRAFQVASSIARSTLSGSLAPERPAMAPIQVELMAALKKAYGQPPPEPGGPSNAGT